MIVRCSIRSIQRFIHPIHQFNPSVLLLYLSHTIHYYYICFVLLLLFYLTFKYNQISPCHLSCKICAKDMKEFLLIAKFFFVFFFCFALIEFTPLKLYATSIELGIATPHVVRIYFHINTKLENQNPISLSKSKSKQYHSRLQIRDETYEYGNANEKKKKKSRKILCLCKYLFIKRKFFLEGDSRPIYANCYMNGVISDST